MKQSIKTDESGFTIVELIVSITVAAIFVISLNSVSISQSYLVQRSRDLIIANSYVEGKFESLRSAGFLSLNDGTIDLTSELPSELKAPRSATQTTTSYSSAIKKVVIHIAYNEQDTPRNYTYATYIGELGVGQN